MNEEELVRYWKDPEARGDRAVEHPAGEIAVEGRPGAGRRAALLAGLGAAAAGALCVGEHLTPVMGTFTVSSPR